ncbi:hypothetical protein JTE90_009301 [Oedothorax gibbosus]|uniref:Uncharacterized protein n=1 Tax=Oedothorax gibbosus TaxID=931172 RepID=A0AAV6U023_9ARAC|nr:hypothetical protein JTE90_009301 [Oedothorax gibbosus]
MQVISLPQSPDATEVKLVQRSVNRWQHPSSTSSDGASSRISSVRSLALKPALQEIEKSGKIVVLELTSREDSIKVSSSQPCETEIEDIDSTIEKKEEEEVHVESHVWRIVAITVSVVLGICALAAVGVVLLFPSKILPK